MNRGFFETNLYISLWQYYEDYMLTNNFIKKSNIYKMDHFLDHFLDHYFQVGLHILTHYSAISFSSFECLEQEAKAYILHLSRTFF